MTEENNQPDPSSNDPRIEIAFSKPKIGMLIMYNLLFITIGVLLIYISGRFNFIIEVFFHLTAFIAIVIFGVSTLFYSAKFFFKAPGLTIDQAGFIDNADTISAGRIYWNEITEIRENKVLGQIMILVMVKDTKRILANKNLWNKLLLYLNWKRFGTPITITCGAIEIDNEKLFQLLEEYIKDRETL